MAMKYTLFELLQQQQQKKTLQQNEKLFKLKMKIFCLFFFFWFFIVSEIPQFVLLTCTIVCNKRQLKLYFVNNQSIHL